MLLSGLRSAVVLALRVADVDIARRWVRVSGKGQGPRRMLNINIFWALAQARVVIADRKEDYNHRRRHSAIG